MHTQSNKVSSCHQDGHETLGCLGTNQPVQANPLGGGLVPHWWGYGVGTQNPPISGHRQQFDICFPRYLHLGGLFPKLTPDLHLTAG